MEERIAKTIEALKRNNMDACYVPTAKEAVQTVKDMLFDGCVITAGGSVSLKESGVWELINAENYRFYDRSRADITEEEKQEAFGKAIGCDFFFCSSNAVTENGELVNVDGQSNRISSIVFGPKKVIMIVGINKLVKDTEEGFLRIKRTVAPRNSKRLGLPNPCVKAGHCISLEKESNPPVTAGCRCSTRICCNYLVSGYQRVKGRISVILCGEPLGY